MGAMTKVQIYWDNQDRSNEGWAYQTSSNGESISSGGVDASSLSEAIERVIWQLGLGIATDDFAVSPEEGGYAVWVTDEPYQLDQYRYENGTLYELRGDVYICCYRSLAKTKKAAIREYESL